MTALVTTSFVTAAMTAASMGAAFSTTMMTLGIFRFATK